MGFITGGAYNTTRPARHPDPVSQTSLCLDAEQGLGTRVAGARSAFQGLVVKQGTLGRVCCPVISRSWDSLDGSLSGQVQAWVSLRGRDGLAYLV